MIAEDEGSRAGHGKMEGALSFAKILPKS